MTFRPPFLIAFALVAGCSGEDGPCGEEACAPCMASNPFSCSGDTICVADACVPAFGRSYVFTVTTGTLPQVDGTGASWDEGGGLPDVFVTLTVNGAVFTTPVVVDSVTPAWNFATPPVPVPADTALRIAVYDDDEPMDTQAWACSTDPVAIEFLRGGGLGCSGPGSLPGARVNVTVRPE